MTAPTRTRSDAELAVLVHALEVHQAELEVQNHELVASVEELRASNVAFALARDRYRALHDLAPIALVTIDRGATIVEVNTAALALLQGPREHLVGRRLALFVGESDRATMHEMISELFESGMIRDRRATLATDAMVPTDVRIDAVILRDDAPARAVLALVDITAVRTADRARHELDRQADELHRTESLVALAGGIAHEFNNHLTAIIGNIEIVLAQLVAGSELREPLDDIRATARSAALLAHQMLAYAGRTSVATRAMDLTELIRELEAVLRTIAGTTPLVIELPRDLPPIACDKAQVRQLVLNLVVNAVEAMKDRVGAITISLRADATVRGVLGSGTCVVLEVRDDGSGMDRITQSRIFEPYFSTKFIGRGLGLAVVEGIVRAHRGAVTVESAVDRGTTFRIYLPAVPAPISLAPSSSAWGGGTILLVDDDDAVRRMLARLIKRAGLGVEPAADGQQAVELFRADPKRFALVLMDLMMPHMNGFQASAAIRELRADIPIVLITGFGDLPEHDPNLFEATLSKPFDIAVLRDLFQRLLVRAR